MRFFHRFLLSLLLAAALAGAHADTMEYRYWDWGKTPKRDDYQVAALKLALEKTVPHYGPYSLVRVVDSFSTRRVRREVTSGQIINIRPGPSRDQAGDDPLERNLAIDVPILGGLLGYRALIIRRDDLDKFKRIKRSAELKQLVAGQGRGWLDVEIYRHNGYRIDDHGNLPTLVPMLLSKRFDYLPMSVIEVQSVLAQHPELADRLAIAPDMLIVYPFSTIFYTSPATPALATRVQRGLSMAKKDGSLDELLMQHFRKELQDIHSGSQRQFILSNPLMPKLQASPQQLARNK